MPSFFLAMIVALLATTGARDQRLVAHLSAKLGQSGALLALCLVICAATAGMAAFAGQGLAAILPPAGKTMLVAFALLLAAAELAWPFSRSLPREPTRSLFAIGIILAARQLGDGARFLIVAIAAGTGSPWLAGVGGGLGSALALVLAWVAGADLIAKFPLRPVRRAIAGLLAAAAVVVGLSARGIL